MCMKEPELKSANFVVELIEDKEGKRQYVIRLAQNGYPLKIVSSPEELAQFFDDFKFEVANAK